MGGFTFPTQKGSPDGAEPSGEPRSCKAHLLADAEREPRDAGAGAGAGELNVGMGVLDRLDRFALAEHRLATVPLLKQMLALEAA